MSLCILCERELLDEAPEHVLLNALGGRKTTTRVLCTACNHALGSEIDEPLATAFDVLRNAANLTSGDGDPPPTIRNIVLSDGTKLDLLPGLKPVYRKVVYVRNPTGVGTEVAIEVPTIERLAAQIENFGKGVKLSRDQMLAALAKADVKVHTSYINEPLPFRFCLGSTEQERAVVKAALVLWALRTSNDEVRSTPFARARIYARDGVPAGGVKPEPWIARCNLAHFPVVRPSQFKAEQLTHSIAVWSDEGGRLVGFYQLFGALGFSLRLAGVGATPSAGIVLHHAPLTSEWICENMPQSGLPNCSSVEVIDNSNEALQKGYGRALTKIYAKLHAEANHEIASGSLRHFIRHEGEKFTPELAGSISMEIAERFVAHLYRSDSTAQRSGAEIVEDLRELIDASVERETGRASFAVEEGADM